MAPHGHHHGRDDAVFDFAEAAPRFRARADAETPRYRRLAASLPNPGTRTAADIGCGAASMAFALAETIPGIEVTAVDAEPAMLELVQERAAERGTPMPTALASVDDAEALAALAPVDFAWAGHVVHHAADPQAALGNLAGLLNPGGRLAIGEGGTAPQFLPANLGTGRPGLELRLIEAGARRLAAELAAHGGTPLPYGWNLALEHAGLTEIRTLNELVAKPAPLTGADLDHALDALATRVDWFAHYLDDDDGDTWTRLLDPEGPDWLGRRRDLHHLAIDTVYTAVRPR